MARKSPDSRKMNAIEAGELTSLALTLALCVLIGYGGGWWIGGKLGHGTAGVYIGLGIGIAAAALEITRVVRRFYPKTDEKPNEASELERNGTDDKR